MNRELDYNDPKVQDEQPSRGRTAERQDAIATNATPSCLPELPVAVEGSPQSEGNMTGIARQIPHHAPTHTQQHTQPKGSGRVNDGASSSAMANTQRSANPEGFMTAEQDVRRKQLDLDLLKVELQKKEIELRERELEFLKREITPAHEPRTDATNARAWLSRAENGVSAAAERCNKNYDVVQYRRNAAYPTAAAENSASYGPEAAEFREWRRAFEERLLRVARNDNGHSTSAPPPFEHSTWASPQFGHSTSARPHASHNGFTGQYAGTFGYESAFLSQSQITARHASSRELPTFSGFPDEWPLFIASYEHSTTICGYSDDENLLRLQKALKGAALEAVGPLLFLPSGLREAISTLRLRFGRPEVIVEGLIEKVKRMPVPRSDRLDILVDFGFAVRNMCATNRAAGLPEYTCNVVLLKELVAKLPSGTCVEWARHRRQLYSVTLTEFGAWIGDLAESLSVVLPVRIEVADNDRRRNVKPSRPDPRQPTAAHLNVHSAASDSKYSPPKFKFSACQEECAALDGCPRFLRMSVAARKEHVKERKLCRKCLKTHKGWCHLKTVCGSNGCEAMHHKLLHGALHADHTPEKHCLTHSGSNDHTLFRYVPVTVHGGNGRTVQTFAFLDEGSSSTFMDHRLLEQLGLSGTSRPLCLKWTGDTTKQEQASMQLAVRISGTYVGAPVHELTKVHTVSNLALPAQSMNTQQLEVAYPHLKGLPVASYIDALPRLLIGIDNCRLGKSLKCAEGRINEPIASKTRLGWMVYGLCPIATANVTGGHRSFHICSFDENNDGVLTTEDKAFDSLELLGVTKLPNPLKSKDDERALEIHKRETKLRGDRFETGLLWKYDAIRLPYNNDTALRRHVPLKRKMTKDPELAAAVNQKMEDYIEKGYIRRSTTCGAESKQPNDWLLPFFPVTNLNKPGMVFDAAAKVSGVSLNSFLLAGPDLLAGLFSVLFKFREFHVAVVGDIRKMFHRVMMRTEDQRNQMILWDGYEPNGDLAVYVVAVMRFGAGCFPNSTQFIENRNADRVEKKIPRTAKSIKDEQYVDDILVLLQEIWRSGIGWNEKLYERRKKKWLTWQRIIPEVRKAVVIDARLAATLIDLHRLDVSRTMYLVHLRNVLSWLRSDRRRYNQLATFRVGELLDSTEVEQRRWIAFTLNVADDETKWTKVPDPTLSFNPPVAPHFGGS